MDYYLQEEKSTCYGLYNMGVLKLLTCGCCGVLTIIDWFNIQKKTKESNFNNLMQMLMF